MLMTMSIIALLVLQGSAASAEKIIIPLDGKSIPENAVLNSVKAEAEIKDGRPALRVKFGKVEWPNIFFKPKEGTWDWSAYSGIAVDVFNPQKQAIQFSVRVDNEGADGWNHCNTGYATALPGKWTTLSMAFRSNKPERFWGMRGVPATGPPASGTPIDLSKIVGFQVFLSHPNQEYTLLIANMRLIADTISLPFVDKFGQYKHETWPGKLKSERELAERREMEEKSLRESKWQDRDRFGGWANGPKQEATGWFRTQKVGGKWWLVDPDGNLFFSIGVDCVRTGDSTFTEKREEWFEWLPGEDEKFKPAVGYSSGAHSMADVIGGKGKTVNFYRANLIRKYGSEWERKFRETACARLKAWGFNTIGNWSQEDVMTSGCLPYVACAHVTGKFRRIEGGGGYWAKMPDVFDAEYAAAAENSIAPVAKKHTADRFCIGFFVDNELAWDAIEKGTLASPPDQPCRVEMIKRLKEKYKTLEALNAAWETKAASWDALRVPDSPNAACQNDLNEWVYAFSHRYFEIIKGVLKKYAPHHLYLGCRFAWSHPQAVRAAADVADVVSFNIYTRGINCADWTGENDLGKPILIGEFHFGALDRGMFHQGLVPTANQRERAESFVKYVRSVIECPAFVGCHWFQYVDEPLTGRVYDGENYNIGLVDVTDTPYPEMIAAAKKVNGEIYKWR
ncbi:MAG: hypothetical protein K6T99_05585 [Armatimonadetes bacterium]|nr:hypothetical protein [Armatimonadota bacterium]